MRNFRKAALAGATAVAVAFGSTAVATAQTSKQTVTNTSTAVATSTVTPTSEVTVVPTSTVVNKPAVVDATVTATKEEKAPAVTNTVTAEPTTATIRPIDPKVDSKEGAEAGLSSKIAKGLGAYDDNGILKPADGTAIFGKEQNFGSQPKWAQLMFAGSIFAAVAAAVGLIIGPAYNFIVHGPVNL